MARDTSFVKVGQDTQNGGYFVSSCSDDGTELARHKDQAAAERAGSKVTCPCCGTRMAQPHVGQSSFATDQRVANGRYR